MTAAADENIDLAQDPEVEAAACADAALACGAFLVASARWNASAGADAAIFRLSEVADWEEGGRTGAEHADRIFSKERTDGPQPATTSPPAAHAPGAAPASAQMSGVGAGKPRVSATSVAQMRALDPVLARTVRRLLMLLGVFSFGP
ncbi:hypothetical protein WJX81_003325 [Elliptochloris bilobata]|uniref:Uncharacterized protein n=1 Tax=Elliptochloris bilobata TaxID=381761 RepID=A0AAW1RHZ2_9CHLO